MMSFRPFRSCRAFLLVCMCFAVSAAFAQYRTSIQGVVTDSTGAVVPGATLTLTNPATNEKQVRTSDDAGVFNFNALAAAPFRLEVEAKSFKKRVLDNVVLIPDQANALNVELEVGAESTVVNVDASQIPALQTQTASVSGVVSDRDIQHLPSFGRDVTKLSQLAPGIFADGSQAGGGGAFFNLPGTQSGPTPSGGSTGIFATENLTPGFSNGNQAQNNGVSIDGISTTSAVWGGATIITPSEDSVDSVKIVTNSYDAEDGRFSGAQLQITSKSGTNDFHGSLFFTTHQPNLNAFQRGFGGGSVTRDNNKFNQFGGSVGGPIWKNKIFAFFTYETVRQPNSDITGTGWYDTPAFGALAAPGSIAATYLNFPGNGVVNHGLSTGNDCAHAGLIEGLNCKTVDGGINLGTPLTTGLGTQDLGWHSESDPGCGGAGTGCGTPGAPFGTEADLANYITSNPTTHTAAQYSGRLDANITNNDRVGFAIYYVPQSTDNFNGARAYDIFHHDQINEAFSVIWNHTFSPTLLNEFRVNSAGWRWNEIDSNGQSPIGLPSDNIGVIGSITPGQFGPSVGSILNQWTYSYKDVATKIIGRHTIKFGGEVTRLFYLQDCAGCGVPNYNFFNLWDFLNDAPKNEGGGFDPNTGVPTTIRQDQRENIFGFFVQDDIKVRHNLTVNLGLRWSYFGPLYSKQDNMLRAFPGAGSAYLTGLSIRKADSWNAQQTNFSPEIGFAWSPSKFNDKLVFRGGYGLNYNGEEIAISANIVNNPGLVVFPNFDTDSPQTINPGILYATSSDPHNLFGYPANTSTISTFGSNGLPVGGNPVGIQVFPNTLPTLKVHHYSFDMQYDLTHNYVMSVGYQGSLSRNTFFHQNPLAVPATQGFALNPQIGGGDFWSVNGRSNYNALLAEVKHQFSHQFSADVQYTWARSNDTSSAPYAEQYYPYNQSLSYGRSDYNVTNAFKAFGSWEPHFFHGNGTLEKIAGGWTVSGIFNWHSGFPYSPNISVGDITPGVNGSLYCGDCGYGQVYPAAYLGGAGTSTSNDAFKGPASSNFPNGPRTYFTNPVVTLFQCPTPTTCQSGTELPTPPGFGRNSLTLPGYRSLDLTLTKAFGLPKMPVLGENAKLEFRLDAFNIFNNLNLDPNQISNNIGNSNFGTISGALAARVLSLGARFNF